MRRGERSLSWSMRRIPLAFHGASSACHCGTLRRYSPFKKTFLDVGAVIAFGMVVLALAIQVPPLWHVPDSPCTRSRMWTKTQADRRLAGLRVAAYKSPR